MCTLMLEGKGTNRIDVGLMLNQKHAINAQSSIKEAKKKKKIANVYSFFRFQGYCHGVNKPQKGRSVSLKGRTKLNKLNRCI